jgi:precorrin-2 methylase
MENKLVFSDREMVKIKEEMEQMKFEVADTIAGLTSLAAASSSKKMNRRGGRKKIYPVK